MSAQLPGGSFSADGDATETAAVNTSNGRKRKKIYGSSDSMSNAATTTTATPSNTLAITQTTTMPSSTVSMAMPALIDIPVQPAAITSTTATTTITTAITPHEVVSIPTPTPAHAHQFPAAQLNSQVTDKATLTSSSSAFHMSVQRGDHSHTEPLAPPSMQSTERHGYSSLKPTTSVIPTSIPAPLPMPTPAHIPLPASQPASAVTSSIPHPRAFSTLPRPLQTQQSKCINCYMSLLLTEQMSW